MSEQIATILGLILAQVPTAAQVIFWITGTVLAILTYRRARKTLLQPAKTEVFKLQVSKLQQLLEFLSWNGEIEAWEKSGLEECFAINAHELIDLYASNKGLKRIGGTERIRPHSSLISLEAAEGKLVLIEPGERESKASSGAPKEPDWTKYVPWAIHTGPKTHETLEQITKFKADPVIPTFVAVELEKLAKDLVDAVEAIGPTMTISAALIAKHYPKTEDIIAAKWNWLPNQHPAEVKYNFYKQVEKIRSDIRVYLKSDQMFDL